MFIQRNTNEWDAADQFAKSRKREKIERDIDGELEIVYDLKRVVENPPVKNNK